MLDENDDTTTSAASGGTEGAAPAKKTAKRAPAKKAAAKKAPAKRAAKKAAATPDASPETPQAPAAADAEAAPAKKAPAKRAPRKTAAKKAAAAPETATPETAPVASAAAESALPADGADAAVEPTVPAKKTTKRAPAKKGTAKKAPAKKAPAKKTAAATTAEAAPVADAPAAEPAALFSAGEVADEPAATTAVAKKAAKKAPAKKAPAKKAPAKKAAAKKTTTKKAAAGASRTPDADPAVQPDDASLETAAEAGAPAVVAPLFQAPDPAKAAPTRQRRRKAAEPAPVAPADEEIADEEAVDGEAVEGENADGETPLADAAPEAPVDTAPEADDADADSDNDDSDDSDDSEQGGGRRRRRRGGRRRRRGGGGGGADASGDDDQDAAGADSTEKADQSERAESSEQSDDAEEQGGRRGGRGGRGSGRNGQKSSGKGADEAAADDGDSDDERSDDERSDDDSGSGSSSSRRRRRRRRAGDGGGEGGDDPANTVTRVRQARSVEDEITSVSGSTRLEAKKQRRREGREAGRRRAPIVSEAEFLARRESVDRVMVIRQRDDLTQIGVLEDKVLVEHYVARESQTSLIGNVYLGRVQNVLPSMEAAFIDIGKGRNAVLYAGEVNWSALGHKDGQPRRIESVLSSGQTVLVQVTKDPIGHKGARLTSQVSLAGRFLVYVPDGTTSGISRKLPDTERSRLKKLLKEIVPESAGVIVRTAAEGASEDELTHDVERLKARWSDIESKVGKGGAPKLLYGEPDLTLKVVRDLFTEDFSRLVIEGDDAWATVSEYVQDVAPDLADRLERHQPDPEANISKDVFERYRIDEQIAKGLDRKVWLPSGGSLVIDRTEAMTVVDVNTGKFTGSGGNLEETVTKNNLEAAEEIVRQLRLRDIGGIIVVDFIDMVLESNRDLVLRRMVECLGRDRTRHQVAEVTSLGLVQMTRKRIGTGLLEAFSETCTHCQGRGLTLHDHPVDTGKGGGSGRDDDERRGGRRGRGGRGKNGDQSNGGGNGGNGGNSGNGGDSGRQSGRATPPKPAIPSPAEVAAMARPDATPVVEADDAAETATETPAVESPTTDIPATDIPATDIPATETPATETPATEAPAAESPATETPAEESAPAAAVTSTVRRSARKPRVVTTGDAVVMTVAPDAQPAEVPAAPPAPTVTVVTRTRRGSSRG